MISYLTGILFEKLFSANLPCLSQPLSRDLENFLYCTTTVLFILLSAGHCCEKTKQKKLLQNAELDFCAHSKTYKWADHSEFLTKYFQVT